ncbi:hypothetical protein PG994_012311 [Apiospora phragmitis]|uniref:Uncharacterized protein n=1 Tax=Apiospora phragmitis TaxID=2905665 RepID=A0ABR1TVB3_9PEZI
MSYIGGAFTYITGLLASPFIALPSAAAEPKQPAEEGTSYFPKTASSSRRSSISSTSTLTSTVSNDSAEALQRPALIRSYTGTNPLPLPGLRLPRAQGGPRHRHAAGPHAPKALSPRLPASRRHCGATTPQD